MKKRLKFVFITSIASPHQVSFSVELQKYFDTSFLFYDQVGLRPEWWKVELPDNCHVMNSVFFKKKSRYLTFSSIKYLNRIKPDILMLGGFSIPSNYLAYVWAKLNGVKTIIFTERSRDKSGMLRKKGVVWSILNFLYKGVDLVLVSAEDSIQQFKSFGFSNVISCPYATDLKSYFNHPIRNRKFGYSFLFPNRLITIYNPLTAIDVFFEIYKLYPKSKLNLNAQGELYNECLKRIKELNIENSVSFLNQIKSWEEMHKVYQESDIMIFPANFSNGNYTILEAMASGMGIVISNKILGLGSEIKDSYNGFKCEPSIDLFVQSIRKYIANPNLFEEHCTINRKIAFEYSAEGVAKKFYQILRENLS